ncbi:MAG TPA: cyclic nucleotide-binding domain-containing protein [Planctomycetota bacterium]|nr:cyclic nucleotide-binding domain-containing protein [Planctomycetota bacterium]
MAKRHTSLEFLKYDDHFVTYHAGDVIFSEGEAGNTMYVVKGGTVELRVDGKVVEKLEEGHIFGEMSLVDNDPRSATAIAASDCQVVPLDSAKFQYMIRQSPYFAIEVMQVITARLRRMTRETMILNKRGSGRRGDSGIRQKT